MGIIYLAALVLGLGTLTLQFVLSHIGGADADGDGDVDDLHLDGGAEELDFDGEVDHELELGHGDLTHGADAGHGTTVGDAVGVFLSMRFWTFALMAFGMVGSLLHYLNLSGFGVGLALAIVSGLFSGLAAALTFRMLKGTVSSSTSQDETIGKMAKVTVPLHKGSLGKVRILVKGKRVDMLAITDAESVDAGDEVVVVEFRGDHALVEPIGKSEPRQD